MSATATLRSLSGIELKPGSIVVVDRPYHCRNNSQLLHLFLPYRREKQVFFEDDIFWRCCKNVETPVNNGLDLPPQWRKQSGNSQRLNHYGHLVVLLEKSLFQGLQGKDEAKVEQGQQSS